MTSPDAPLQPSDITQPGAYWYFDDIGGDAQIVDVGDAEMPRADWEVRFTGRGDADSLGEMSGFFMGPVRRPTRPQP